MRIPTIHMNGTGGASLLLANGKARDAVGEAMQRMIDATPNGRDYYPQGPEAIGEALADHMAMQRKLKDVYDALGEIMQGIEEQIP